MKLIKIEANQGMSFRTRWVNASLRTVLFIDIFLICSVILSLKLLERKKGGITANVEGRENLTGNWQEYKQKPGSSELCSESSCSLYVLQQNHPSLFHS